MSRIRAWGIAILAAVWVLPAAAGVVPEGSEPATLMGLADRVAALRLGSPAGVIGSRLTPEEIARDRVAGAAAVYPGTVHVRRGRETIVVDEDSGLVLAVFRREEKADRAVMREMVGRLMTRFGEPTTTAHDKLIYWAYGPDGLLDQDAWRSAQEGSGLEILATVKFSTALPLETASGDSLAPARGPVYYIITSDPLLQAYLKGAGFTPEP